MGSLCNVELPAKTSSASTAQLQGFIEDELARMPLLIEELVRQYAEVPIRFSADATTQERQAAFNRRDALLRAIPQMGQAFSQSLREQVGSMAKRQAAVVRGKSLERAGTSDLSLVDENEMAVEVALQRTVVMIHSAAESEMRELGRFTSALVGDANVACDTNPFKPEAYAQALLAAAQSLPGPLAEQMAFIHQAAMPFSQALRKTCAAAAARLQAQGVEPASHRTIILPPSASSSRALTSPADLDASSDAVTLPLDMDPVPPPRMSSAPARPASAVRRATEEPGVPATAAEAESGIHLQGVERLTRLFDAVLSDSGLPQDLQRLLLRLHSLAASAVPHDPAMLKSSRHPAWTFMDRLVFEAGRHDGEPEARARLMRYADGLVGHMEREPVQDAALYGWGLGRIEAYARHRLARLCLDAQAHIDSLRSLVATWPGDAAGASASVLFALKPGDWLRLSQQDQWRELLLLWTDDRGEAWLFRQPGGRTLALRRMALERLIEAGLAQPWVPSSLMQRAAQMLRTASSSTRWRARCSTALGTRQSSVA